MATATVQKQPPLVVDLQTATANVPAPISLASTAAGAIDIFAQLARENVDVEKIDKLMQLHERLLNRSAEEQFNAAMADAQTEMRPIAADANNPSTKSRYASYAQLDRALRPIYTKHGFGISFDTGDTSIADHVRVLAYVTHRGGGARTYRVDMPNDGKGAKGGDVMTKTHATGAAMSYGMRYLLKMIWNVAVGEDDRDGNPVEPKPAKVPAGYDDWLIDMESCADDGWPYLRDAYNKSKLEYREHLVNTANAKWEALKRRAAEITRKQNQEAGR